MTATMAQIRTALADALSVLPGVQTSAYMLSNPTLPAAMIKRGDITYDEAMVGGVHSLEMIVTLLVSDVSDIGASTLLDQYLAPDGDLSVKQALEADTQLGGLVSDLHVTDANGEQTFVREGGGPMIGSEWIVDLWL